MYAFWASVNDRIQRGDMAFKLVEIIIRMMVKVPCMVIKHTCYWLGLEILK